MKVHLASAGLILLGFVGPALAADLPRRVDVPVKAMPVPPPVVSAWTGFYIGVHGGYGWGKNPFREDVEGPEDIVGSIGGINSSGWVFGGHAGYNWQYGRVVAGLEVDFSATDIKGSATPVTLVNADETETVTFERQDRTKYLGSVRARLGALPTDNVLFFGTAGLAWQHLERTQRRTEVNSDGVGSIDVSTDVFDRFGWVAGAGIEAKLFGSNWLGRVEYLHYEFGRFGTFNDTNFTAQGVTSVSVGTSGRQTIDIVRGGLSYRFTP
jgi:outer membrane immunogenic protein